MKKNFTILILLLLGINYSHSKTIVTQNFELQELTGGKEKYKERMIEWENSRNAVEEGVDWRVLNQESMYSKYLSKQNNIKNGTDQVQSESIIDGRLIGQWIERGSNNQSGRIHCVDIDFENDLIYAASSGGNIWRGTLDGENWTCLNNSLQFNNVHFVKIIKNIDKKRIVAGAYNTSSFWFSDDEGNTWNKSQGIEPIAGWNHLKSTISVNDEDGTIYCTRRAWNDNNSTYLYKSIDHGNNFELISKIQVSVDKCDLWTPQYDSDKAYILIADELFEIGTDNALIKISELPFDFFNDNNPDNGIEMYLKGALFQGNLQFVVMQRTNQGEYKFINSQDGGMTWSISSESQNNNMFMKYNSFASSTYTTDYLFFGGVEMYKSEDASSSSWQKINEWGAYYNQPKSKLHADIPGIQLFRDPNTGEEIVIISTDGGLYKSYDYCNSVENISLKGLNVSQYYSVYTSEDDPNYIHAGAQDQGYQLSRKDSNGTLGFEQVISGDYGSITSSDGGNNVWTVYPTFVMCFTNVFSNSMDRLDWRFVGKGWAWMTPTVASPANPRVAYMVGGNTDNGSYLWRVQINQNFDLSTSPLSANMVDTYGFKLTDLHITNNHDFLSLSNNGKFLRSVDGINWDVNDIESDPIKSQYLNGNAIAYDENRDYVYVGTSGYSGEGFYFSKDGGQTWTASTEGLPNTSISELAITPNGSIVFAATRIGPYMYLTENEQWYSISGSNTADNDFRSVEYIASSNTVRFATYGRGIWDLKIESINSVENNSGNIDFNVLNYPNPVNSNSNIKLYSENDGIYVINIYDASGNKVKDLYNGYLPKGTHNFSWDLFDGTNRKVPSGMYYYTVSVNGITKYSKMIIE